MPAPILFFRLLSLEQAEWLNPDGDIQRGPLTQLAAQAGHARQILVAPGEKVILHRITAPSRKRSTWARAVPYALEDQVVEDIEELHFALGHPPDDGKLPVAVVSHTTLRSWLQACSQAGLSPIAVIADSLLLPWREESWSLLLEDQRAVVRTGRWDGFAVEREMLDLLLGQALAEAGDAKPRQLRLWGDPAIEFTDPSIADIERSIEVSPPEPLSLFATAYQPGVVLNLLQGSYSRQAQWGRWLRPWRATAALAAFWLLVQGGAQVYEYGRLQHELVTLTTEMERVYKEAVPGATKIVNPRIQLETRLHDLRPTGSNNQAFFELLYRGAQPLVNFPAVTLRGISYRDGQLDLSLQGGDPAVLDQLRQQLNQQQSGLQAEMRTTQREGQLESKVTLKKTAS